jgi:long-chain fatty acid transport protein
MKKSTLLTVVFLGLIQSVWAGGILTNANQSAQYIRMLSRNASTDIDAVYFNPAGLVKLNDGWHFSFNNQSIFQTRTIENKYPLLNDETYEGGVTVPVFPTLFAAYKTNKLAFSFGFGINSGGGTAEYENGLPSFEIPFSNLPSLISGMGVPTLNYSADLFFNGSSVFLGFQFGCSYEISDFMSISAGGRLLDAVNDYEGHIQNILINPQHPVVNPDGGFIPATSFFDALGQDGYAQLTTNKEVDVQQKGFGITPIIGLNLNSGEKLNIGMRYEFRTTLEMENETEIDGTGQFPDGEKFRNDIPAILAAGIDYQLLDNFKLSGSFSNYFDKAADWSGKENDIEKNYYELAGGLELQLNEVTTISAGVMHSETGVGRGYQTDISYSLSSNSVGLGAKFKVSDAFDMDLGVLNTVYENGYKEIEYAGVGTYKELYDKSNLAFSIGLTYHLLK